VHIEPVPSAGPGNIVIVEYQFQNVTEVATAFGRLGTSAETVANEASGRIKDYLKSDCPVGENLSDQILLPLALSAGGSGGQAGCRGGSFRTHTMSQHLRTHIAVLQQLLPVRIQEEQEDGGLKITVSPTNP